MARARVVTLSVAALLGAWVLPALGDPPCRPLQPPRPICVPDVPVPSISPHPLPSISVPPFPTLSPGPIPSVGPSPSFSPRPLPTIGPTGLPTVSPTIGPIPIPPVSGASTSWIPGNAGVMWYQPSGIGFPAQPAGEGTGSWWLTRRVTQSDAGVMHLGSLLNGLYISTGGGAWASATPGCLLPRISPFGIPTLWDLVRDAAIAASGLDACAIEGIAYDPIVANRVYVSAFDVTSLSLSGAQIVEGGVYVSDDGGFHFRKLLGGIRGNGLAVSRPGGLFATIVVGYIQTNNNNVGSTPGGGSLSVSNDDGLTWRSVVLPPSGCPDGVSTSQRLTPTVAVNPAYPNVFYAGTNAGLYVSADAGRMWTLATAGCTNTWGLAASLDGTTLYVGDSDGVVHKASTIGTGMTVLKDLGTGEVQSLAIDPLNANRLYAAVWAGGSAGVYRIDTRTGASSKLGDSLITGTFGIPAPFPVTYEHANGSAPSLFLARVPGRLYASTQLRGVFVRGE